PLLTIKTGLCQFGLALGVWSLTRLERRWPALALAIVGGIVGSLSNATGIAIWPAMLLGMLILGLRKPKFIAAWMAGAAISAASFVFFLFLAHSRTDQSALQSLARPMFIVDLIGGALAKNGSWYAEPDFIVHLTGALGLLLLAAGLSLMIARRRWQLVVQSAPALMLTAFGLMCILEIFAFRGGLAPWYTSWSTDFWMGLAGLAYILWDREVQDRFTDDAKPRWAGPSPARLLKSPVALWTVTVVLCIGILGLRANFSHHDKSFYLPSRSPAAAACLRNYRTAPTYCETRLVGWLPGHIDYLPSLASPLEAHGLSVFAPSEEWSMQGDSYLSKVDYHQAPGALVIFWTADKSARPVSPVDYRPLNIFLHSPNWVSWKVTLPAHLKSAELASAVTIAQAGPRHSSADGVTATVFVQAEGESERLIFSEHLDPQTRAWSSFSAQLLEYAGKTITIRLGSDPGANTIDDWTLYRYPRIDLLTAGNSDAPGKAGGPPIQPSNTDLSPDLPAVTPNDSIIPLEQLTATALEGASAESGARAWNVTGAGAALEYAAPTPMAIANYTYFMIRISSTESSQPRAIRVTYSVPGESGFSPGRSFAIPLLIDHGLHTYSYDLRLLPEPNKSIAGLRIEPIDSPGPEGNVLKITDVRLIHK
ncbi:MAG TPA: hypothetical protein VLZ81_04870, partial [Blastocatellia bacterium]|nr:hypothetical protein [Blastocatellia bacterium]